MTNPTHTSQRTYICMGCLRGFRKPRSERRFHETRCFYFIELDDYGNWQNPDGWGYVDQYDLDDRENWWRENYRQSPDWSGEPQFYEKTTIDGKDIILMKAAEVARLRKDGLAR